MAAGAAGHDEHRTAADVGTCTGAHRLPPGMRVTEERELHLTS